MNKTIFLFFVIFVIAMKGNKTPIANKKEFTSNTKNHVKIATAPYIWPILSAMLICSEMKPNIFTNKEKSIKKDTPPVGLVHHKEKKSYHSHKGNNYIFNKGAGNHNKRTHGSRKNTQFRKN